MGRRPAGTGKRAYLRKKRLSSSFIAKEGLGRVIGPHINCRQAGTQVGRAHQLCVTTISEVLGEDTTKPHREEGLTNGVEPVESTECYPGANTRGTWDTDRLLPSPTPPLGRVDFRRQSGGTCVGNSWRVGLYTRFKPKDWSARINLKLSYISVSTNQHVTSILAAHFCTIMEKKY